MALSIAAMIPAASGLLGPVSGAILQEFIDIVAIAVALTALLPDRVHTVDLPPEDLEATRRLHAEHEAMIPLIERVRRSPTLSMTPLPIRLRCAT
ncbi:hypothetical protein GCM10029992_47590 [Glycomyces albus]